MRTEFYAYLHAYRRWLLSGLAIFALFNLSSCDNSSRADTHVSELNDLYTLGQQAKQDGLPIMLLFSAKWCEYCIVLKEQVINPMLINGMYEGKWLFIRQVSIDDSEPMKMMDGSVMKKSNWAYKLNADLTPTILFLDGNGKKVAEPIIGISEITLYASLIHARLNEAYQNMGLTKQIPATPELLEKSLQEPL